MTTYARIKSQIYYFEAGLAEQAIRNDKKNGKSRKAARSNAIGLILNHCQQNKDFGKYRDIYRKIATKTADDLLNSIYGKAISSVQDLVDYQTQVQLGIPMF